LCIIWLIDISCLDRAGRASPWSFHTWRKSQQNGIIQAMKNIHGEDYATAQDKTTKSRHSTRPKREEAFLPHDARCAVETVLVFGLCFDRLHSCLDSVQGHGDISVGGSAGGSQDLRRKTYTVIIPATPPIPKVLRAPSFSPGAT
jgi:hypothetical protein